MKVELVSRPTVRPMVDPFGRQVTYLRVSVTDRCDFRCVYCMSEHMTFLPKKDLLTLEELDRLCSVFIARGVKKIRITGGELLVRKNIIWLFHYLSRHLRSGLGGADLQCGITRAHRGWKRQPAGTSGGSG